MLEHVDRGLMPEVFLLLLVRLEEDRSNVKL